MKKSKCEDNGQTITATFRKVFAEEWRKTCRELRRYKGLDKIRITSEVNVNEHD